MAVRARRSLALALVATPAVIAAQTATPSQRVIVVSPFAGGDGGDAANLSGMACAPVDAGGKRDCLLVDDEGTLAQWAVLDGLRLIPGKRVALTPTPETIAAVTAGSRCNGIAPADKQDADGEAVAYDGRYWYVLGSHGCKRKKGTFSPPAFLVYRVPAGAERADAASAGVALALRQTAALAGYWEEPLVEPGPGGKPPKPGEPPWRTVPPGGGVTAEGLAVSGGRLWVGLRAPVRNGRALLLGIDPVALFAVPAAAAAATVVDVPLGADTGISDLAALPDGRLLVLAGSAQQQAVAFTLDVVDPATGTVTPIRRWRRPGGAHDPKAEGVAVLGGDAATVRVMVMYEDPAQAAPEQLTVMPGRARHP